MGGNESKSIEQLEGYVAPDPQLDTYVTSTRHRLRKKPIGEFTTEDLRFSIHQGDGLTWLLPLAVERLELDPLQAGDMYEGDLLASVLRLSADRWALHVDLRDRLLQLLDTLEALPDELVELAAGFRAACGPGPSA